MSEHQSIDVIDQTHPPNLGPDAFHRRLRDLVLADDRARLVRHHAVVGPFQPDVNGYEGVLLIAVAREQKLSQIREVGQAGDLVERQFNLGGRHDREGWGFE